MKSIEVDDQLYAYIASQTKFIGESASDILRRLLMSDEAATQTEATQPQDTPPEAAITEPQATPSNDVKPPVATVVDGVLGDRVNSQSMADFDKKVDRFLFVLSQLYQIHTEAFAIIEDIRGKDRLYFATSEDALRATGKSTNPKAIPESPYWVVTNNNSEKKTRLLSQAMTLLGYDKDAIDGVVDLVNQ